MHARTPPLDRARRTPGTAPLRRPGAVGGVAPVQPAGRAASSSRLTRRAGRGGGTHPLVRLQDNARLGAYEQGVKSAFDGIVPTLKRIAALQGSPDFEPRAQAIARDEMGFDLPEAFLANAWVEGLDMRRLFAFSVFQTYRRSCDAFISGDPLAGDGFDDFDGFLQSCGFHLLDVTPCADGRLAHVIRYVLRLPYRSVRRKSYAGSMFDIEDSVQKWVEVELSRFREGVPNAASDPTRYLKAVVYHYSSVDPMHQGCAAHGSDDAKAASLGLARLVAFQEAVESGFCCGASIDLMLIGLDTDTDAIRVHVPDGEGRIDLDTHVEALALFEATRGLDAEGARAAVARAVRAASGEVPDGTARLIARLIENNFSQIAYVREVHGDHYADTGHAERFIGTGVGFEDIQLRNLMYFAYLTTLEEGAADMDVGIKIFTGLNVSRGLPAPVVVRFDYHGHVPGARDLAVERCGRVTEALKARYAQLWEKGLLHILQVVRDCAANAALEVLACTANPDVQQGAH